MLQLRPVLLAIGIMIALMGVAMVPCGLLDLYDGRPEAYIFNFSAFGALAAGACLAILSAGGRMVTGQREAFLLTVLVWIIMPFIGAVPLMASGMSLTDAMFESMSGLTTTGSTVLTGLDDLPRGLLLWRGILQWIGGIGIIVTAIAILPMLRVGGMQLFQIESSDVSGKFLPRVTEIAAQTGIIYIALTIMCGILYVANGMTSFDAVVHSMTTMSTGGFSTHDASFGYFGNGAVSVAILFMILAALPFARMVMMVRGQPLALLKDPQFRLFVSLAFIAVTIMLAYAAGPGEAVYDTGSQALRNTAFNIISVMSGTGYANEDYGLWGPGAQAVFIALLLLGGSAGSSACGIKMFRIEISLKAVLAYAKRMTHPHRLAPVRYAGRVVSKDTLQSVMVFVFLFFATFVISAALLSLTGLDAISAISGAATTLGNVGPGLGELIGPSGTFQQISGAAKWVCTITMLLGRLEFVAVFVVLTRRFWVG